MSQNPINLMVRFFLEIAALAAMGYWGWLQSDGVLRYLFTVGLPLLAAFVWGIFRAPADASARRRAPVAVRGWLRLLIELTFFGFATWGLFNTGATTAGWIIAGITLVHYVVSYDRIGWLLKQ